jgi:site-specific recombinase XerC
VVIHPPQPNMKEVTPFIKLQFIGKRNLGINTRESISQLIQHDQLTSNDYLFKSRVKASDRLSTRQYSRVVDHWVESINLDATQYGTHTMRRTKPSVIYKKTKNLRACQLLLGHTKLESTVSFIGLEVDEALEVSEGIDS